jgi:hypothetical protein
MTSSRYRVNSIPSCIQINHGENGKPEGNNRKELQQPDPSAKPSTRIALKGEEDQEVAPTQGQKQQDRFGVDQHHAEMAALELSRSLPHSGQKTVDGPRVEIDCLPGQQLVHQCPRTSHQAVPQKRPQGYPTVAFQERGRRGRIMMMLPRTLFICNLYEKNQDAGCSLGWPLVKSSKQIS